MGKSGYTGLSVTQFRENMIQLGQRFEKLK